ncbi:hypothetical protein EV126DRAFT_153057 [Verticillium dahliae]|nr:hypothetical protein EV126DRAFT_153057 [Verticillium dahliae]
MILDFFRGIIVLISCKNGSCSGCSINGVSILLFPSCRPRSRCSLVPRCSDMAHCHLHQHAQRHKHLACLALSTRLDLVRSRSRIRLWRPKTALVHGSRSCVIPPVHKSNHALSICVESAQLVTSNWTISITSSRKVGTLVHNFHERPLMHLKGT